MTKKNRWLPPYFKTPRSWSAHPRKKMLMTPVLIFFGAIFAFGVTTAIAAILQIFVFNPPASNEWAPVTDNGLKGRMTFQRNGCVYCHSGFTRPQDVRSGLYYTYPRISKPGDYFGIENSPNILGSARWGPDLSFESGWHPDDWQRAHFYDPRYVDPLSVMPRFSFFSNDEVEDLITFLQTRGGKGGLVRTASQEWMKRAQIAVNGSQPMPKGFEGARLTLADMTKPIFSNPVPPKGGYDSLTFPDPININIIPRDFWFADNPLPITKNNLIRGREIFQERCIGCHGQGGAAISLAARFLRPVPVDFTPIDNAKSGNDTAPGVYFYRIMRGIPGTAMEDFGTRLRADDIWRTIMFLKTIPNGGLSPNKVPVPKMYVQWKPPDTMKAYIKKHPLDEDTGAFEPDQRKDDPFMLEAWRILPGLGRNDHFKIPGFGLVSRKAAATGIKKIYNRLLDDGWTDLKTRSGPKPPPDQKDIPPDLNLEQR